MRFSDKLARKRKESNLSQEQLAEKMNVSRQSVSKWENGSSYPDMDKIIELTKILECKLEDLLDDGVIGESVKLNKVNKNTLKSYYKIFIDYITKVINTFSRMTFRELLKCVFELLFVSFILYILSMIISSGIESIFRNIFWGNYFLEFFNRFVSAITYLLCTILSVIILFHLFNIRYLNYYLLNDQIINKELNKVEEKTEPELQISNKQTEKIIVRDYKDSTNHFFGIFGRIFRVCFKAFILFFSIPILMGIAVLAMSLVFSIYLANTGILFIYVSIIILALLVISYLFIKLLYSYVFNLEYNYKVSFILFFSSIVLFGLMSGAALVELESYEIVNDDKLVKMDTMTIDNLDNVNIHDYLYIDYKIDNSKNNIVIDYYCSNYIECKITKEYYSDDENIYFEKKVTPFDIVSEIKDELKSKRINFPYTKEKVVITLNQENYKKIFAE